MDEDSDRSSEATQVEDMEEQKNDDGEEDDGGGEDSGHQNGNDDVVDEDEDEEGDDELERSPMPIEEDCRTSLSETLISDLAEVPIKYAMRQDELEKLKNQLQGSHQEALAIVIAQAAQAHSENHIQLPGVPSSSSQLTTIDVPPISSLPSSNSQVFSPAERDHKITSDPKTASALRTVKTPIDGYNWRKYGQKQVKSPQGSRSYYKCTYAECDAKKIESCDQYDSITKIVYKGHHNHDPPKKVYTRGGKLISTSSKRKSTIGSKRQKSNATVENGLIEIEQIDAPEPKRRVKKSNSASPGSVLKRPKKPKFVVHAAADVGISADGYRWRKYGQKSVKGNRHPRNLRVCYNADTTLGNYYKCTSAGCPVRKHIEMATDGISEMIITYKGVHDHDMPVPKKGQGSPTCLLITGSSSAAKNDTQSKKSKDSTNQVSTTEALDDVGEKKSDDSSQTEKKSEDSARTLVSVGFEIKPC